MADIKNIAIKEIEGTYPQREVAEFYEDENWDHQELLEDIKSKGKIEVPLKVHRVAGSRSYQIRDGYKRYLVAKELGLSVVPVEVVSEKGGEGPKWKSI